MKTTLCLLCGLLCAAVARADDVNPVVASGMAGIVTNVTDSTNSATTAVFTPSTLTNWATIVMIPRAAVYAEWGREATTNSPIWPAGSVWNWEWPIVPTGTLYLRATNTATKLDVWPFRKE